VVIGPLTSPQWISRPFTCDRRQSGGSPIFPSPSGCRGGATSRAFSRPISTQSQECIMRFGSKSLSLEDRNKNRLDVETDYDAIAITQPRI
jgi:hypothetical protein